MILNTDYKYDEFGRYYYLTVVGAEKLTGIDTLGTDWKNAEVSLKRQGLLLKSIMTISTNEDTRIRFRRKDFVEYIQYTDEDKRNSVFTMLSEIAFWSWQSDGDLIAYEDRNPNDFINRLPMTVRIEGRNSGMIYMGQTIFEVPEDEYQVGY